MSKTQAAFTFVVGLAWIGWFFAVLCINFKRLKNIGLSDYQIYMGFLFGDFRHIRFGSKEFKLIIYMYLEIFSGLLVIGILFLAFTKIFLT